MQTSDTIDALAPAFVKAQHACEGAKKASENAAFKSGGRASRYADLSAVWGACQDALEANDLAVIQGLGEIANGAMHMYTMVVHKSGQWIKAHASIPLQKVDPQGYGSATTYLRRYALAAMMGIIQEDDDGNAASRPAPKNENTGEPRINAQQCAELRKLLATAGATEESFVDYLRCGTLPELPAARFPAAKSALEKRISAQTPSTEREAA